MTIGILTNTYPPNLNGVSITTQQLVDGLRARGVKVVVATPKVKDVRYPDYVLPLRSIPLPKSIRADIAVPVFYSSLVGDYFREQGVELVHSMDTVFGGLEGAQIAQDMDLPCVHTYHTYIESYRSIDVPGYVPFIRELTKRVCNSYDVVISLSTKIHSYLNQLEIRTELVQMLNSVDLKQVGKPDWDNQMAVSLGIKADDFVILTFGRVNKSKGLSQGLEVVAPLLKSHRRAKYIMAGEGAYASVLRRQAIRLGINDQVILYGKFNPQTRRSLCSLAKFFLFTSSSDNLPTTLLEAMSCGLPVISLNDSSVDYILKHGQNGIKTELAELSSYCGDLYDDPKWLSRLSRGALASSREIGARDIIGEYISLYQRLINSHQPHQDKQNILEQYFGKLNSKEETWFKGSWNKLWKL
jgi:1,2-diacylglycerol 3-alpha-glucosyltransferase